MRKKEFWLDSYRQPSFSCHSDEIISFLESQLRDGIRVEATIGDTVYEGIDEIKRNASRLSKLDRVDFLPRGPSGDRLSSDVWMWFNRDEASITFVKSGTDPDITKDIYENSKEFLKKRRGWGLVVLRNLISFSFFSIIPALFTFLIVLLSDAVTMENFIFIFVPYVVFFGFIGTGLEKIIPSVVIHTTKLNNFFTRNKDKIIWAVIGALGAAVLSWGERLFGLIVDQSGGSPLP